MNKRINLDGSVLAPKDPLSMEPADAEGHIVQRVRSATDDTELRSLPADAEGHIRSPWADGTDVRTSPDDDTEGHRRF